MHEVGIYAIADIAGALFRLLILQSWSGSYLPYILHPISAQQRLSLLQNRTKKSQNDVGHITQPHDPYATRLLDNQTTITYHSTSHIS